MWCDPCQQDVPVVLSTRGEQRLCCSRCATELATDHQGPEALPDWSMDDWELEQDLKELSTLTAALERDDALTNPVPQRVDTPAEADPDTGSKGPLTGSKGPFTGWTWLLGGTAAILAGGAQLAWAWWIQQHQLLVAGACLAIAGQLLLTLGLLRRLEAVARRQDEPSAPPSSTKLSEKVATAQRENPPPAHQLLADIRARLDQLAAPGRFDEGALR